MLDLADDMIESESLDREETDMFAVRAFEKME